MTYDLYCPTCKTTVERECRVAERENQTCDHCSTKLENVTTPTSRIVIPGRFYTTREDMLGPNA